MIRSMENDKIYGLVDSLQELLFVSPELVADKAVEGINAFCQPVALSVKITLPDARILHKTVGKMTHLKTLKQYEKKFANLDVSSAQFVLDDSQRQIVSITKLQYFRDFQGTFSVIIDSINPCKHMISQIIELFTANIALALSMQSFKRPVDLDSLLTQIYAQINHLGVDGIGLSHIEKPDQIYWIDTKGKQRLIPPEQIITTLREKSDKTSAEKISEINSILPSNREYKNIAWGEFKIGGTTVTGLFAGDFRQSEIVFSKFRSIISDIDNLTGYDEIVQAFKTLKEDHKLIVKGEKIAAILETAVAVNHEINNPLTAILGNTQLILLQEDKMPSEITDKIKVIEISALRIRKVTQRLMSVVEPITTSYTDSLDMLDIRKSSKSENK